MKKALKITGKILLVLLLLIVVFLLILFIYHRVMLKKEDKLLENYPGELVEVNGHNMNVYSEGEGEHKLVFLAPAGDTAPMMTFKPLYTKLSDTCETVVVEKFGYGMSDIVDTERDYETMVDECRQALSKAGVQAPYVLCPYSKSGLDALIWAQKYPEEVEAIVGIDMGFPKHYDSIDTDVPDQSWLYDILRGMGIARLFTTDSELGDLCPDEDKPFVRALVNRKFSNKDTFGEIIHVKDAVDVINSAAKPAVPMKLFVTNGGGTGLSPEEWKNAVHAYTNDIENVEYTELDSDHNRIIEENSEQMSSEIKDYFNK